MTMSLPVVITEIPSIMEWIKPGYNGLFFTLSKTESSSKIVWSLSLEIKDSGRVFHKEMEK